MTNLRLPWQAEALQASLNARWPELLVQAVAEVGSTNTELLDRARAGSSRPTVLVAEHQTQGRGRQGRRWWAAAGDSLTFSIALPLQPRTGWGPLSLVVGHAVAQVLQPWPADDGADQALMGSGRLMLKWPNDLWWYDAAPQTADQRADGAKVGGILIETSPWPPGVAAGAASASVPARWAVIGIGVNLRTPVVPPPSTVNPAPGVTSAPAATPAESTAESPAESPTIAPLAAGTDRWRGHETAPALWHQLVPAVLEAVRDFEQQGWQGLRRAITARNVLHGHAVSLSAGPVPEGRCVGLDEDGALLVDDGYQVHRIVAGEARIRPLVPTGPSGSGAVGLQPLKAEGTQA